MPQGQKNTGTLAPEKEKIPSLENSPEVLKEQDTETFTYVEGRSLSKETSKKPSYSEKRRIEKYWEQGSFEATRNPLPSSREENQEVSEGIRAQDVETLSFTENSAENLRKFDSLAFFTGQALTKYLQQHFDQYPEGQKHDMLQHILSQGPSIFLTLPNLSPSEQMALARMQEAETTQTDAAQLVTQLWRVSTSLAFTQFLSARSVIENTNAYQKDTQKSAQTTKREAKQAEEKLKDNWFVKFNKDFQTNPLNAVLETGKSALIKTWEVAKQIPKEVLIAGGVVLALYWVLKDDDTSSEKEKASQPWWKKLFGGFGLAELATGGTLLSLAMTGGVTAVYQYMQTELEGKTGLERTEAIDAMVDRIPDWVISQKQKKFLKKSLSVVDTAGNKLESKLENLKAEWKEKKAEILAWAEKNGIPLGKWLSDLEENFDTLYHEYIGENTGKIVTLGSILSVWFLRRGIFSLATTLASGGAGVAKKVLFFGKGKLLAGAGIGALIMYFTTTADQRKQAVDTLQEKFPTYITQAAQQTAEYVQTAAEVATRFSGLSGNEVVDFEKAQTMIPKLKNVLQMVLELPVPQHHLIEQIRSDFQFLHDQLVANLQQKLTDLEYLNPDSDPVSIDFRSLFFLVSAFAPELVRLSEHNDDAQSGTTPICATLSLLGQEFDLEQSPESPTLDTTLIAVNTHVRTMIENHWKPHGFFLEEEKSSVHDFFDEYFFSPEAQKRMRQFLADASGNLKSELQQYPLDMLIGGLVIAGLGFALHKLKGNGMALRFGIVAILAPHAFALAKEDSSTKLSHAKLENVQNALGGMWGEMMQNMHLPSLTQMLADMKTDFLPHNVAYLLNQMGAQFSDMAVDFKDSGTENSRRHVWTQSLASLEQLARDDDDPNILQRIEKIREKMQENSGKKSMTLFTGDLAYFAWWAAEKKGLSPSVTDQQYGEQWGYCLVIGDKDDGIIFPGLSKRPLPEDEHMTPREANQRMTHMTLTGLHALQGGIDAYYTPDSVSRLEGEKYSDIRSRLKDAHSSISDLIKRISLKGFSAFGPADFKRFTQALARIECEIVLKNNNTEIHVRIPNQKDSVFIGMHWEVDGKRFREHQDIINRGATWTAGQGMTETYSQVNQDVARKFLWIMPSESEAHTLITEYLANPDLQNDPIWLARLMKTVAFNESMGITFQATGFVFFYGSASLAVNALGSTMETAWGILQASGILPGEKSYKQVLHDAGGIFALVAAPAVGAAIGGAASSLTLGVFGLIGGAVAGKITKKGWGGKGAEIGARAGARSGWKTGTKVGWKIGTVSWHMAKATAKSPWTLNRIAQNPIRRMQLVGTTISRPFHRMGTSQFMYDKWRIASLKKLYVQAQAEIYYWKTRGAQAVTGKGSRLEFLSRWQGEIENELKTLYGKGNEKTAEAELKNAVKTANVKQKYYNPRARSLGHNFGRFFKKIKPKPGSALDRLTSKTGANRALAVYSIVMGAQSISQIDMARQHVEHASSELLAQYADNPPIADLVKQIRSDQLQMLEFKKLIAQGHLTSATFAGGAEISALAKNMKYAEKLGKWAGKIFAISMLADIVQYNTHEMPILRKQVDLLVQQIQSALDSNTITEQEYQQMTELLAEQKGLLNQEQIVGSLEKIVMLGLIKYGKAPVVLLATGIAYLGLDAYGSALESERDALRTPLEWSRYPQDVLIHHWITTTADFTAGDSMRVFTSDNQIDREKIQTREHILDALLLQASEPFPHRNICKNFLRLQLESRNYGVFDMQTAQKLLCQSALLVDAMANIHRIDLLDIYDHFPNLPHTDQIIRILADGTIFQKLESPEPLSKSALSSLELRAIECLIFLQEQTSPPPARPEIPTHLSELDRALLTLAREWGYDGDDPKQFFTAQYKDVRGIYWNPKKGSWFVNSTRSKDGTDLALGNVAALLGKDRSVGNDTQTLAKILEHMRNNPEYILRERGERWNDIGTSIVNGKHATKVCAQKVHDMIEILEGRAPRQDSEIRPLDLPDDTLQVQRKIETHRSNARHLQALEWEARQIFATATLSPEEMKEATKYWNQFQTIIDQILQTGTLSDERASLSQMVISQIPKILDHVHESELPHELKSTFSHLGAEIALAFSVQYHIKLSGNDGDPALAQNIAPIYRPLFRSAQKDQFLPRFAQHVQSLMTHQDPLDTSPFAQMQANARKILVFIQHIENEQTQALALRAIITHHEFEPWMEPFLESYLRISPNPQQKIELLAHVALQAPFDPQKHNEWLLQLFELATQDKNQHVISQIRRHIAPRLSDISSHTDLARLVPNAYVDAILQLRIVREKIRDLEYEMREGTYANQHSWSEKRQDRAQLEKWKQQAHDYEKLISKTQKKIDAHATVESSLISFRQSIETPRKKSA